MSAWRPAERRWRQAGEHATASGWGEAASSPPSGRHSATACPTSPASAPTICLSTSVTSVLESRLPPHGGAAAVAAVPAPSTLEIYRRRQAGLSGSQRRRRASARQRQSRARWASAWWRPGGQSEAEAQSGGRGRCLVLFYLLMTADRCTYDIGLKINDMSSELSRSAIIYGFNRGFFVFVLVDCKIKSTGTLAYLKASFGPALELSRSPRPCVFTSTGAAAGRAERRRSAAGGRR